MRDPRAGAFALLAAANLLWAGNWIVGRALRDAFDPVSLNFYRWLVAVAVRPEEKRWWRAFSDGGAALVTLRGEHLDVRGTVVEGGSREAALRAYLHRYPRSRRITEGAAVVVFETRDG